MHCRRDAINRPWSKTFKVAVIPRQEEVVDLGDDGLYRVVMVQHKPNENPSVFVLLARTA